MSSNNNMDREIIDPCQAKVNNFNILLQEYNSIERYFTLPLRDFMPSNKMKAYWAYNFNRVLKYYII